MIFHKFGACISLHLIIGLTKLELSHVVWWNVVVSIMQPAISFAGQSKVSSCAVVGNAGFMLQKHYGSFIDSHDLVVRCYHQQLEFFVHDCPMHSAVAPISDL